MLPISNKNYLKKIITLVNSYTYNFIHIEGDNACGTVKWTTLYIRMYYSIEV